MAKTRQQKIKAHCIRHPLPKRCGKEIFHRRIRATGRSLGIREIRFYLYGKQVQLFSEHQALEPLLKRNKTNKQFSARLTRWLDRLNHFDISLKHTAGKEIKVTDFVSRNPTENPEPEKNCGEIVINAIAQLATVNARTGRILNQSESANTYSETNMHHTRTLIDTRHYQSNKGHIDSNYHTLQPLTYKITANYSTIRRITMIIKMQESFEQKDNCVKLGRRRRRYGNYQ